MAKKRRVFITMRSTGEMTIFDWERHIEEVQAALIGTVAGDDWEQTHVYGPNTGGFSPPAMCIEASMTLAELGAFLERLTHASPWLTLPVEAHIAGTEPTVNMLGEMKPDDGSVPVAR